MSYILTALKKSEQERTGDVAPQARAPASLVVSETDQPAKPRAKGLLIGVGGGGALAILAIAVWAGGLWPAADGPEQVVAVVAPAPPGPDLDTRPVDGPPTVAARNDAPQAASSESVPAPEPRARATAVAPAPPAVAETISTGDQVDEPSAGGQLPTQRLPRPVPTAPETAPRLAALNLDPPVTPTPAPDTVVAAMQPRAVVATESPPPETVRPKAGAAIDGERADIAVEALDPPPPPPQTKSKIVNVTPDTAATDSRTDIAALPASRAGSGSLTEAADLHERGWSFERSGNFTRAIDSFTRALEIRPDFADAYFGRGWIHDRMDELERASADYGQAISIEPTFAAAYGSRGVALFYLNEMAAAEADFSQTMQLGRGEIRRFAMLWRYLSAEHDGRDGAVLLAADAKNINLARWPGIIAKFYLDRVGAEAVLSEANDPNPTVRRERLCVAYFFIAQKHLLAGRAEQARDYFQKALDTGVTEFIQHKAAQRELDRLTRLR